MTTNAIKFFKFYFQSLFSFQIYSISFYDCSLKQEDIQCIEAVVRKCSVRKVFLQILQISQENTCARVSFLIKLQAKACNFIKKETLAQVFSCEFCEISKNTFNYRTPLVAASERTNQSTIVEITIIIFTLCDESLYTVIAL